METKTLQVRYSRDHRAELLPQECGPVSASGETVGLEELLETVFVCKCV